MIGNSIISQMSVISGNISLLDGCVGEWEQFVYMWMAALFITCTAIVRGCTSEWSWFYE